MDLQFSPESQIGGIQGGLAGLEKIDKLADSLRGDYTTRFGNSILYYNFLMNSLKFIKVYIIRKGISQGRQSWYYFFTKNQHFWENHKKHIFCHFSFKTGYKKIEILKIALELFYWLKTSIYVFSFLRVFADFLSFMPNKAKISLFTKFSNFWPYLACNFKNRQKLAKMRKHNI